jgi:hypothetical protein
MRQKTLTNNNFVPLVCDYVRLVCGYVFFHIPYVIRQTIYYLRQYFSIQKRVRLRLKEKTKERPIYGDPKYSRAKFIIATTYTTLCANIVIDLINKNNRFPLLKRQELSALIDFYFLVILADDSIDTMKADDEEKKVNTIKDYFEGFHILADNPENVKLTNFSNEIKAELKVFVKDYLNLWKKEYKDPLNKVLDRIKTAYIKETKTQSLSSAWQSLYRIARVSIDLYELMGSCIVEKKLENKGLRQILYNLAFSGNMIDDWMDYYWLKEDQSNPKCYLNYLGKKYQPALSRLGIKNYKTNPIFYLFSFFISSYYLGKRLFKIRIKNKLEADQLWFVPSFLLLGLIVGPLSIIIHLKEKKGVRSNRRSLSSRYSAKS